MSPIAELAATGRYVPDRILTNADFESMVDTSDQWIRERTGIRERHISNDDETLAHMSKQAALQVLEELEMHPEQLDAIIVATASPDRLLPSQACDLQAVLGAHNAMAMDVGAACSGFLYAATTAQGMIAAGTAERILVVGGERLSRITNYKDRATCILFGDGAGATLVRPANGGSGILSSYLKSDGRLAELLYRPAGGSQIPFSEKTASNGSQHITMAGREVFKHAVRSMSDACDHALQRAGLTGEDIDLMIPHQANIRIIESTAKHAGIPMDKVVVNVDRYGNTSAASIPIALDEEVRAGRIEKGSKVLLAAFGGGFTWGSMVIQW